MKLLSAFLKLIRWQNLLFIVLTQLLFFYCIVQPILKEAMLMPNLSGINLFLLSLSSVFIAAAGNIINDYFDLNIDIINKPTQVIVDRVIKRRWVIIWHIVLSAAGVGIGFYIDAVSPVKFLGLANLACVILLFVYSISLKKKLLSGNILISLLTAWTVLVIAFCETSNFVFNLNSPFIIKLTRLSFLYAGFAYVISLIREVIKDMEDTEGDRRYGCRTMPIVWGFVASKIFTAVWMIILITTLVIVQFYVLQFKWWFSAAYCIAFIIYPLIKCFRLLMKAKTPADYHAISSMVKWAMLTGILSMVFFRIYE